MKTAVGTPFAIHVPSARGIRPTILAFPIAVSRAPNELVAGLLLEESTHADLQDHIAKPGTPKAIRIEVPWPRKNTARALPL